MLCSSCKNNISVESKFCEHCGHKVNENDRPNHPITNEIVDHLEYQGYEIEKIVQNKNTDIFTAIHKNKSNLVIKVANEFAIIVECSYTLDKEKIKKNGEDIFKTINAFNLHGIICSYCFDSQNDSIICTSWFPPIYLKKEFSRFLDLFNSEIMEQLRSEEFKKYY